MTLYDDVFVALAESGVRYVVVGGTAVILRGHLRSTVDLDLVVDLEPQPAQLRETWIAEQHMTVLSFYDPAKPFREVDVFVAYPMDFDALLASASPIRIAGVDVPVAARAHLISMKRIVGRPQDLEDADALERLEGA